MVTPATSFGSFNFDSTTRSGIEGWEERLLQRVDFQPRIYGEGSQIALEQLEGREFRLQGFVGGDSRDAARVNLGALILALENGEQYLYRYNDRRIAAWAAGPISWREVKGSALVFYRWSATLRSQYPFWEATSATQSSFNKTGAGPWTRILGACNGSAQSRLKVEMTFNTAISAKTFNIKNLNTNLELRVHNVSVLANEKIVVDFERRIVHDGSDNEVFPGSIEGDWWTLDANGSITTIEVTHDFGGSADVDFVTTFYDKYYSY